MDLEQVVKLLELMKAHGLDEVEVEDGDLRIKLRKGGAAVAAPMMAAPMPIAHMPAPAGAPAAPAPETVKDANLVEIKSPMVGTFYRASAPDSDPFVAEGDAVHGDTVIAIIEAMKVMNEIKAEVEGEVVEVLVENGESVEFGQPLMIVRKSGSGQ